MTYNLTYIANQSGNASIVGFTQVLNTEVMQGWLGILILIGVCTVAFLGFYKSTRNPMLSFIAVSWLNFILCFFLWMLSLVPNIAIFISLLATAGLIAFSRGIRE